MSDDEVFVALLVASGFPSKLETDNFSYTSMRIPAAGTLRRFYFQIIATHTSQLANDVLGHLQLRPLKYPLSVDSQWEKV